MMRINALRVAGVLCCAALGTLFLSFQMTSAASRPKRLSSYDPQVKELLAKMTLDEKIGQMTQPEHEPVLQNAGDMQKYFIGSVLSGGNSDPMVNGKADNSVQAWTDLYDRVQSEALKTRLGIPILYGVDAVHGHNNVLGAVIFPHNIGLGCHPRSRARRKDRADHRRRSARHGDQWTFAPCVTVPQDIRWGRTYEGFSEDPAIVRVLGEAAVRGLQGPDLNSPLSILACVKHYVGDGGTSPGAAGPSNVAPTGAGASARVRLDQGDTKVDEATLRRIHLPGYITAIQAGVGSIMPSYSSWNGVKCSASKRLLTDILKQELGFEGFLISDYNAIDQIKPGDFKGSIEISINAGMDMAMEPTNYRTYFSNLKALVDEGKVPMSRIDDAVTRILRVKFAMGLMDKNRSQLADRKLQRTFGSPEHRAVAREAVRKSLVLLKNDKKALPLSSRQPGFTSPARAPTTSAINAAAGPSNGRGRPGRSRRAARRFSPPLKPRSLRRRSYPLRRTVRARKAPRSAWWSSANVPTPRARATAPISRSARKTSTLSTT